MKQLSAIIMMTYLSAAAVITLFNCTTNVSGVETTNGFTVTASSTGIEGTAPAFSSVYLFDTAYIPCIDSGFGYATAVTPKENFTFPLSGGSYNLFVYLHSGDLAGTAQKVILTDETDASASRQLSLKKTTVITGTVTMRANSTVLVYIPGSNFFRILNESGPFTLIGIPAGTYRVNVARFSDTFAPFTVLDSSTVEITTGTSHDCGTFTID
jgi:hypothetical protein